MRVASLLLPMLDDVPRPIREEAALEILREATMSPLEKEQLSRVAPLVS
jgi:hypothetical protein